MSLSEAGLTCPLDIIGVVHTARTATEPYVTRFDRPAGEPRCGWFDTVPMPEGVTPADLKD